MFAMQRIDDQQDRVLVARAHETLRSIFGYDSFRSCQADVIAQVAAGGDAFVLMPTGSGKSLCYQIPAMLRPGVGVIVSPLIALMQDQVSALRQLGVRAAFLNSTQSAAEAREVERLVQAGKLDLVYIAPERLLTDRIIALLAQSPLALFAIDEAHCVSQWGHDFREEYLQLYRLPLQFPQVPRIALTATADALTRREILERLSLQEARIFATGFDRPNIRYRVALKQNQKQQLKAFLRDEHPTDCGIVYCLTRRKTEEIAEWLQSEGWNALPYHAGMDAEARRRHQHRFQNEDGVIIVATIAFGMGIDKPDVRFVVHMDIPKSIEAYYQETGRSGRDGQPADALMLYGLSDVAMMRQILAQSEADEAHKRVETQKFNALLGFCETATCRRLVLLNYFGEARDEPCGNCDTCLQPVETWDGTLAARKALYVVRQTGQRFGVGHLTDILTGADTPRVHELRHHQLSAFGGGKELPNKEWASVFRQLTAMGFLTVDAEGHGSLKLTPSGLEVLGQQQTVSLRKDPLPKREREKRRRTPAAVATLPPDEQALWEALRELRLELAQKAAVPPYVIFHDSTLREMLQHRPRTLAEMGRLPGVGEAKLRRYGHLFLELLRDHAGEQALPVPKPARAPADDDPAETVEDTLRLARLGMSPEAIAIRRELTVDTIYTHLAAAIEDGRLALRGVLKLDDDEIGRIEDAIFSLPEEDRHRLRPVYDALEGQYNYGIIRCVLADLVFRFGVE
ncbi:MAG: DNA helicase RecQ [Armatimonadota bacterium]